MLRINALAIFLWAAFPSIGMSELSAQAKQDHILFASGGSGLDSEARSQIAALGNILNVEPMNLACFRLVGYSDSSGGTAINLQISKARAEAVADALRQVLDRPSRIVEIDGLGASGYLTDVAPSDPRQRRVAIMARRCQGGT